MNTRLIGIVSIGWLALLAAGLMIAAVAPPAGAQTGGPYDLSWNVIAGGGGKSRDGVTYSMRGTIGQAAAGDMAGGVYSLTGGFWAVPAQRGGDVNSDGAVDVLDLLWVVYCFGTSEGDPLYTGSCDFNDDDAVDVFDLLTLVYAFGT